MQLKARCRPEYWNMLGAVKQTEFRQIESIILENTETGETKTFAVTDIHKLEEVAAEHVKTTHPAVEWNPHQPIYGIGLGLEMGERVESDDDEGKFESFHHRKKGGELR